MTNCTLKSNKYLAKNVSVQESSSYKWIIPDFDCYFFEADQMVSPKFITGDKDGLVWNLILRRENSQKILLQVYLEKNSDHYENVRFDARYVHAHDQDVYFHFDKPFSTKLYEVGSNIILQTATFDYTEMIDQIPNGTLTIKFKVHSGMDNFNDSSVCSKINQSELTICDFESFENLLEDTHFSDVKLVVGDREFTAHKNILSARSPVFLDMFTRKTRKNEDNPWVEEITDVHPKVMQEFLRFLYVGKIRDFRSLKVGLLIAADKYKVAKLVEICEQAIIDDLTVENAADALLLADCYNVSKLKFEIIKLFKAHGNEIVKTERFRSVKDFLSVRTLNNLLEKIL